MTNQKKYFLALFFISISLSIFSFAQQQTPRNIQMPEATNFIVLQDTGLVFNAILNADKKVKLRWETSAVMNNGGFSIYRSTDSISFSSLGYVAGIVSNEPVTNYIFIDENPLPGKTYYLLEVKGIEKGRTYSEIKTILILRTLDISVYPNPVQKVLTIKTGIPFINAKLRISNTDGQNVLKQILNGEGNVPVNVSTFTSGVYYGKIILEDGKQHRFKFIKE